MELDALLKNMGLVDAFAADDDILIQAGGGDCGAACSGSCTSGCSSGCYTSCSPGKT